MSSRSAVGGALLLALAGLGWEQNAAEWFPHMKKQPAIEPFEAKQDIGVCAGKPVNRYRRPSQPTSSADSHPLDVRFRQESIYRVRQMFYIIGES